MQLVFITKANLSRNPAPARGILEWYGHCILYFIFLLSGLALVVSSCFALHCHWLLLFHVTVVIQHGKTKTNPADSWWGVGGCSRTTKREQLAVSNCMHALHSHQLSATTWVPLPSDCIAHGLRLLIVRRPKSGTAKTVPAVPAVPALV